MLGINRRNGGVIVAGLDVLTQQKRIQASLINQLHDEHIVSGLSDDRLPQNKGAYCKMTLLLLLVASLLFQKMFPIC